MRRFIEVKRGCSIAIDDIVDFRVSNDTANLDDKGVVIIKRDNSLMYRTTTFSYNELKAILEGDNYITK